MTDHDLTDNCSATEEFEQTFPEEDGLLRWGKECLDGSEGWRAVKEGEAVEALFLVEQF